MEIFNRQDGADDFWITQHDNPNEESVLSFCISEDYITNCFGFLMAKKDVAELKEALSEWLNKNP